VLWNLPHIAVPVDTLFYIPFGNPNGFPVTNTFIITWISILLIIGLFYAAARHPRIIPTPIQNFVEWVVQMLLNLCEEVAGKENGRRFFPWVATIFLFVLIANWWEIIPGVESIGTPEHGAHAWLVLGPIQLLTGADSNKLTPWVRPPSTDLNLTLAIAVVSVVMTQVYGFRKLGAFAHITKYFNYREGLMGIAVGILEAILEAARIVSFSFRLFGNLFAGDVLLLVMAFLVPFAGATLFYFLEVFVGFIQAFVFAMLTLVFMTLSVTPHEHHEEHAEEHDARAPASDRGALPAAVETTTAA
jgi:F-type H+-transporting ATPase subunit a